VKAGTLLSRTLVAGAVLVTAVLTGTVLTGSTLTGGRPAPLAKQLRFSLTAASRPAGGGTPGICSKDANGNLASCPAPVPRALLPASARDQSTVTGLVTDPARLVDTRTWTSSGGNTYPGAQVPFGMIQWSPDTMPHRTDGGGYTYGDRRLTSYSLTHLSGVGCPSAGDIGILPMTGRLPNGNPSRVVTSFTNSGEAARAGYYSARSNSPGTITSKFTAAAHSAIGQFTFPRGRTADFLIKLRASEGGDYTSSVKLLSGDEVQGSITTGNFCKETSKYGPQLYRVYFDIVFSRPFKSSRVIVERGRKVPNSVFLRFGTPSARTISAKAAISYVGVANARDNWVKEIPGWNFAHVAGAANGAWNALLGRIKVSGGSVAKTQEFYSLLYKDFLQPNIISDANGQYRGSDLRIHKLGSGQASQYGMFSGWDTYHSAAQLQAMLDPAATSDMAQSLVNYYAQNQILPQWGFVYLDNYAMVGDPSDAIIGDYYAFGARRFDTSRALADMLKQATTVNRIRPGMRLEKTYGYLPQDGRYGCCGARGFLAALLEYDTADFALSRFAAALGDSADAATLAHRANNWAHIFNRNNHLLTPRLKSGRFLAGITKTTYRKLYIEGDAYEYLWDVPNDYADLFALLGGKARVAGELRQYLAQPNGQGVHAKLANEFDLGEQNALDYAGDPAGTQRVVANIRNHLYLPGPDGLRNNDDLGSESSQFIWNMLGIYPENPGSDTLVFASPGFPKAVIALPGGKTITINAAGASKTRFYVRSLKLNGAAYSKLYVSFATLAQGSTLTWSLGKTPTSWGSAPADAPPSYGPAPAPPKA
jgi:predicted alpha-1,2-mannosidase